MRAEQKVVYEIISTCGYRQGEDGFAHLASPGRAHNQCTEFTHGVAG